MPEENIPVVFTPSLLTTSVIFFPSEADETIAPLFLLTKYAPFPESPSLTIASPVSE